ncbi:PREDICTED: uncharacterized protein LOC109580643 [Amphimedon queenslandica]|uniref:SEA domain-containing protein n=1 Tax=Amphimedon queenslandica TaxID=400682 RepID=A0AAN0IYS4_AMPQE|nr:PREDICTED: uncharacterized protein LOC109580643 [Amphimedon queenslandica]|eukprot:XP_019849606.1 PREDICTED: uncharacterized protein LOC109580643 [Amphimedon queenslandica]
MDSSECVALLFILLAAQESLGKCLSEDSTVVPLATTITEHALFSSSSSVQFITSSSLYLLSSFAPNPTLLPISDGVVVVFKGSNASTFDVENFKNITAKAINSYCSVNCRKNTRGLIVPDNIVITEITETINGLMVIFYVSSQYGALVDASIVTTAVKAAESQYNDAGISITSITPLDPPSNTATTDVSLAPADEELSAGQIAGIVTGIVTGVLTIIIILIILIALMNYLNTSSCQNIYTKKTRNGIVQNIYHNSTGSVISSI